MSDMHLILQELFKVGRVERREITLVSAPRTAPIWERVEKLLKVKGVEPRTVTRQMLFDLHRLFPQVQGQIDLARHIYMIGTYRPARVPADGYLLARRSEADGQVIAMFHAAPSAVQPFWTRAFAPDAPGIYVTRYIPSALRDDALRAYGVVEDGGNDCFHELHPYVLEHREHYLAKFGVDIGPPAASEG